VLGFITAWCGLRKRDVLKLVCLAPHICKLITFRRRGSLVTHIIYVHYHDVLNLFD